MMMRSNKLSTRVLSLGALAVGLIACQGKVEVTTQPPPQPPPAPPPPAPAPPPKMEKITVTERIQFETDSDILTEGSKVVLTNQVVKVLKDNPHITLVEIGGHTDSTGGKDDNLLLSQRRADSVKAYLVSQGIAANRLRAMGYGTRVPVAPNNTEEGRTQNRRVEFRIIKQGGGAP
jgi:OOP family OmpA-OmpF porin